MARLTVSREVDASKSGVLNTDFLLPDKCSLPVDITCVDYDVEASQVTLILRNNFVEGITINRIEVKNRNGGSCFSPVPKDLNPNEKTTFVIFGCDNTAGGDRFHGDLEITYTKKNSVLPHTIAGSIVARVSGSGSSSSGICQDAEDNALCEGLDIVFGEGYQAACCIDYTLCCG